MTTTTTLTNQRLVFLLNSMKWAEMREKNCNTKTETAKTIRATPHINGLCAAHAHTENRMIHCARIKHGSRARLSSFQDCVVMVIWCLSPHSFLFADCERISAKTKEKTFNNNNNNNSRLRTSSVYFILFYNVMYVN